MAAKNNLILQKLGKDLNQLQDEMIFTPEDIQSYTRGWRLNLHSYSFRNYLLAYIQYPKLKLLAGYRRWQELGRQVMKGQKGLTIIGPRRYTKEKKDGDEEEILYFRPVKIFDINQTGVPIDVNYGIQGIHIQFTWDDPEKMVNLGGAKNTVNYGSFTLQDFVDKCPVPVTILDPNTFSDGHTNNKMIAMAKRKNESGMIAAGFHELGHIYLDHFEEDLPREVQEVEAEAFSYICCSFFEIHNPDSAKYIQHWKGDKELLKDRGGKILAAAERMIKLYYQNQEDC